MVHRVLIVDDNEASLLSFTAMLAPMPVITETANSGFTAIRLARENRYSLILLDIQMPGMDGFETLERLRTIPEHAFTPIILISAVFLEDQYKIKGIQTGAVDFIPKPVNPEVLRVKVQVFLDLEENRLKLNELIEELQLKNNQLTIEIQKRIEVARELEDARAAAEKASDNKSQLLVNMSHEIRTPVNTILGFADLITSPTVSSSDKEKYLKYLSNSSQNLLFLIDEILEHSRLEAGELKINKEYVNIKGLCQELEESFGHILIQAGKEKLVQLRLEKDSDIPDPVLLTDPQRLRQILSNLLGNAIKYTSEGQIVFGYETVGSKIEFYVKDSGIGIDPESIPEIFNRFKRIDSQVEMKTSGTGLGLSISKNLVELLGGNIWVESEIGAGSVFRFNLPKEPAGQNQLNTGELFNSNSTSEEEWSGKTVLIAEDEELNYLLLQESLKMTGIHLLWARNGRECLDLVSSHAGINVVLMDIRMPEIDGYETTKRIKTLRPDLPIVIQTAYVLPDEKNRSIREWSDDFIGKPINRAQLLSIMSKYLNG